MFLPLSLVKINILESLHDQEVAFSASDRQGSNFESCVWRTQFSLYVHKAGLKLHSFYFLNKLTLCLLNQAIFI